MGISGVPMTPAVIQQLARDGLQQVRSVCDRMQILTLDRQIEACEGLFVENPPIDVAILGQFKAGKSSFVNSLIGQLLTQRRLDFDAGGSDVLYIQPAHPDAAQTVGVLRQVDRSLAKQHPGILTVDDFPGQNHIFSHFFQRNDSQTDSPSSHRMTALPHQA